MSWECERCKHYEEDHNPHVFNFVDHCDFCPEYQLNDVVRDEECSCQKPSPDGVIIGGFLFSKKNKSKGVFCYCIKCGKRIYSKRGKYERK